MAKDVSGAASQDPVLACFKGKVVNMPTIYGHEYVIWLFGMNSVPINHPHESICEARVWCTMAG